MNIEVFRKKFWDKFEGMKRNKPAYLHWDPIEAPKLDLCPDVEGMMSLRKQQLLNLAFSLLDEGEAYLEVGAYKGKSLLSAMLNNAERPVFACDNFSEFEGNDFRVTTANLERYGLRDKVTFYDQDFLGIFDREHLPIPIGCYFYDGAHDEESQYQAIRLVEPFLAGEALVLVDDWRHGFDSGSYAKQGTLRAVAESAHEWRLLYELPARFNGDRALWWNGLGVFAFRRRS